MAIYFFDKNQTLIKIVPESATFEAIQTQELDDDSLLKDTLSVTIKGDEKLIDAEYMAVKSYTGNAQAFDMYRIVTDTTPDKSMSFTGMSLAPYELNGHIIQDLRPANHSLSYTLNRVLDGTDWRVGYIEDGLSNVTTTFYYVSAKEALKELQSLVGCEFVFKVEISGQKITDKWIEVYSEMGNRTKKRFNYGTNALTVVRETNKADIYTALIGRGKGEEVSSGEDNASGQAGYGRKITFEDIEWKKSSGKPLDKPKGQYYLELPQATQTYGIKNIDGTMKARVGIVDFDDEEDKNRLINLTYKQLLVSSRPKVLFKTTVANIGATGIGDTVTIHRHDLNIHYQTRVRKIVRNKLNDNKTQIELGDAVVTASTKQTKQNNATIKNLNNEIDKIKANVTTSQNSADGKNTIFYGSATPERQRTGDTWYRPHPSIAGETQMLTWNGTAWELVIDTSDLTSVSRAVNDAAKKADEAVQAAKDADTKANDAIAKAGANANLLTTHQNTIDTINTVTLPDIASSAGTALANAKDAMDEAKKADEKIADFVRTNGLVSGTTVDTKINDATGEISKRITTVEGKIPTEIGGRNLLVGSADMKLRPEDAYGSYKYLLRPNIISIADKVKVGDTLTFSFDIWAEKETNVSVYDSTENPNMQFGSENIIASPTKKRVSFTKKITSTSKNNLNLWYMNFYNNNNGIKFWVENIKIEKGSIPTDWTPAPEDNYTQEEFKIFESTYDEDVKGIKSSLTSLENDKLDGSTYTTFYKNEYEKTAEGLKDAYTKIDKIVDENGNTKDTFAKAVYDQNAARRTASFNEVTKDLVTTTTYSEGVKGINQSISTIRGDLDNLKIGGRNYILNSDFSDEKNNWNSKNFTILRDRSTYGGSGYFARIPAVISWGDYADISNVPVGIVTFSAYVRSINGESEVRLATNFYDENNAMLGTQTNALIANYAMKRYSFTFEVPSRTKRIRLYLHNYSATSEIDITRLQLESGNKMTDWSQAPEDLLGKADFQFFKSDYEKNDQTIKSRLTAIDSSEEGSIAYRLNETEKTANGNTITISNIKTKPGEQITGYQTMKERSDLYERVIGSSNEAAVKQNMSRIVMTDSVFQTEVVDKQSLISGAASGTGMTKDPYFDKGINGLRVYDNGNTGTITIKQVKIPSDTTFPPPNGTDGYRVDIVHAPSTATSPDRGGILNLTNGWAGGTVVVKFVAFLPTGRSFNYHNNNLGTGYTAGWLTDNKGTGKWETYMYYYRFGTGSVSIFGHLTVTGASTGFTWYLSDYDIINVNETSASKFTQLVDSISLKVSNADLLSQINVQAGSVLIQSGTNKLNVTPETTYIEDSTIKSAMIESLEADKIETGTLDAGKVKVVNLDANNITANITDFIKTNWNEATGGGVTITGSGVRAINSEGSRVTLENGVVSVGNRAGVNLGFFGDHVLNKDATGTMTITASYGTETAFISATGTDGKTYKRSMSIMAGAGEIDMFTTLNMNKNSLKDVTDIGFTGGLIKGSISGSARYMTIEAGTGTAFDVSGVTRMSVTSVVNIFSGIDMKGNDIASVGKLTYNSDQRLKTNIKDTNIRALDAIRNWQLVSYDWLESGEHVEIGLIAQNSPEVMTYNIESDIYGIDAGKQTMINTLAIQQLDSKTDDEISRLKAQIASLQDELALLKGD